MPPGAARDALAIRIDRVAAQRYATDSRMFWLTDLDAAKAEAARTGKPILSLRMLGRLDEDLSCANSRYFRVALYANADLSKFLRDRFVLHWSSERAVPRVTVDFGDGRIVERTVAGNSAHYVLDAAGRPIDVLPGLYAPALFRSELEGAIALHGRLSRDAGSRERALVEHHRRQHQARASQWAQLGRVVLPSRSNRGVNALTVGKAMSEVPMLRVVDLGPKVGRLPLGDDDEAWAAIGMELLARQDGAVLDARSKALLARLAPRAWTQAPTTPLGPAELVQLTNRFERSLLADSAMNEFDLRQQTRNLLAANPNLSFEQLNEQIYAAVFKTPASDAWLGLAPTGITALPGDGLVASPN
jgi:hypothetical protein